MKYRADMTPEALDAFRQELRALARTYEEAGPLTSGLEDEGSLEYFNRYVAGDR